MSMRPIQITFDERLLAELDADPEVRRDGRSAVLRRAAFQYLRRKQRTSIAADYAKAYGKGADDFADWASEGTWPDE